jgi:hypothetical protein
MLRTWMALMNIYLRYSMFVKAWNYSSMPAYKSRFWNQEAEINKPKESRMP